MTGDPGPQRGGAQEPLRAMPASADPGAPMPIFDDAIFASTFAFLPRSEVATYLRALGGRFEAMRGRLRPPDLAAEAAALAVDAHRLIGSAGLLGFLAVSTAARAFEEAAEADGSAIAARAVQLDAALEASMDELARLLTRATCGQVDSHGRTKSRAKTSDGAAGANPGSGTPR